MSYDSGILVCSILSSVPAVMGILFLYTCTGRRFLNALFD
jgi:hypothetical protein